MTDQEDMRRMFELINRPDVDNFTILGIGRDADGDAVRQAYLPIAKRYNPHVKREADEQPTVLAIFLRVTKAYKNLSDPASREAHRAQLDGQVKGAAVRPSV